MLQEVLLVDGFLIFFMFMPIWGRCPHFETAILLIYSQYLYPAKVASPQKGQNEGMMPVWTMTKVILSFSHNYGSENSSPWSAWVFGSKICGFATCMIVGEGV